MQALGPVAVNDTTPVSFQFQGSGIAPYVNLYVENDTEVNVRVQIGTTVYLASPASMTKYALGGFETGFTVTPLSVPAIPGSVSAMVFTAQDPQPLETVRRSGF